MTRRARQALVIAISLVTGCAPTVAGPIPPRPAEPGVVSITTRPTPTTTVVAGETVEAGPACPTRFCLVYHLDPRARWSDGSPVIADDLAHTVSVRGDDPAHATIRTVDVVDDHTALVVFDEPYGAWQSLFRRVIRTGETPTSIVDLSTTGPFEFVEWDEGSHLTIARQDDWWALRDPLSGATLGDVGQITFRFFDDTAAMTAALAEGAVDVIVGARPNLAMVAAIGGIEGLSLALSPGPFWEHIDFHHEHPLLSRRWAREAISLAIDREKILDRTVRLVAPETTVLDSSVYMSETVGYEPHFPDEFDPERAGAILQDNGCNPGSDGILVCDDIRMSLTWTSTDDDPARSEAFQSVREDLGEIGVELIAELRSPSSFVTRDVLFGGPEVWQLINFSWRSRPDPIGSNSTYYCGEGGELNVNRYCSEKVESLISASRSVTDPAARMALYNQADRLYLEDYALIPLYQKPVLTAWADPIEGPLANYTPSGDLWNVASWSGKESIVVALPSEPVDMSPLSEMDDSANIVLGALLYGAFGMSPSHEYLPALVESVDVLDGRR